jgi:hypothetical protein
MLDKNVCKNNRYFQLLVMIVLIKKSNYLNFKFNPKSKFG